MTISRLMAGLVLLGLTACTGGNASPASSRPGDGPTTVGPTTRARVNVAGTAAFPLVVEVAPGEFTGPGTVGSGPSAEPPPGWPGFTATGDVRELTVTGSLAAPVTLGFAAGPSRPDSVPVIWRKDPGAGWYPVAVGDAGGTASAARSEFSPHVPGLADVAGWTSDAAGAVGRWARGRTTPPTCGATPSWADLTAPTLDVLLACVQTNTADGVARTELKVKNNRGLVQSVEVPAGVAYADVEDQPETVRGLVRALSGGTDRVLLPPGKELRVGFARPATIDSAPTLVPETTALTLASELVVRLSDLAEEQGSLALLPALLNTAACTGLKSQVVSGVVPDSLSAVKDLTVGVFRCLFEAAADPKVAVSLAQQVVAAGSGVPLAVVQSDASFNARVQKAAGKLNLAGKLAKAAKTAEIAVLAGVVWEGVGEQLGRASVSTDPAAVRLALSAPPRPAPVRVAVTGTSVGGVAFGTPAAQAEQRLRALLGAPTDTFDGGCSILQETARYLTWGPLTVHLSDASAHGQVPMSLQGWVVRAGRSALPLSLPHGLTVGASEDQVRRLAGIRDEYTDLDGNLALLGGDEVEYVFDWPGAGSGGKVTVISGNNPPCD